jgi:uncharacterized NAD-dependent epimerase/dehydratase family protein
MTTLLHPLKNKMEKAIILSGGLLHTADAKTAHGLIRESNRYQIVGIVDAVNAGKDAGELLDGRSRGLPIFETVEEAISLSPTYCIVGVATTGGIFPASMLEEVRVAIVNGMSVVNGLHDYLTERPDIAALALAHNVQLIDIRKPKLRPDLHFWTGVIRNLKTPVVAIIGTDCSLGKRTTTRLLLHECAENKIDAQMIYTGQTGWIQGGKYGFIFDSTLNDFVGGELEHAILTCVEDTKADVVLVEGQAALRNPSGPCGSELLISGNAKHVVLVHAPKRVYYDHIESWGKIPGIASEIALIELYGSKVIAIAINTEDCSQEEGLEFQKQYALQFNLPVLLPLQEGCGKLIPILKQMIDEYKID